MLCIHNKYNSLKQLGLDTLANMALRVSWAFYVCQLYLTRTSCSQVVDNYRLFLMLYYNSMSAFMLIVERLFVMVYYIISLWHSSVVQKFTLSVLFM